mmetsp:Transcript_5617/g.23822  ORF Transcript_5617/g.23822 Transcript_5617/m.23822 type:complete len:223 (-) Transcript_5617:172-840(-)
MARALSEAVENGDTTLGIRAGNGVVLATKKVLATTLVDEASVQQIAIIADHVGIAYAGMGPDFRVLVKHGQKIAQKYKRTYGEPIPVLELVRGVARTMQEFTQSGGVRPFGVSLLVAGWDQVEGPSLYQVDPSGTYFGWKASAVGKEQAAAKAFLEKRFDDDMDVDDAVHTSIMTLREGFEGEVTASNIEIAMAVPDESCPAGGRFMVLPVAEVGDYLDEGE